MMLCLQLYVPDIFSCFEMADNILHSLPTSQFISHLYKYLMSCLIINTVLY